MYWEVLKNVGLTKSEIAVYTALLDIGSSTTGPIIKKAGIASGKAYLILDKLIQKGLVTHVVKSGTKYYQAKDPERLLDYLKEKKAELKRKEEALKKIIPHMKMKYDSKKYESMAEVYEGVKGFKTFYDFILKDLEKGDCIEIMGVPKEANEKFGTYIFNWNKKRIKAGISLRIIYNHGVGRIGRERAKMGLSSVKYMEQETPAWVVIFKDYVATIHVHGEPVCFLIRNKEVADSYRNYFKIMWKQAKK